MVEAPPMVVACRLITAGRLPTAEVLIVAAERLRPVVAADITVAEAEVVTMAEVAAGAVVTHHPAAATVAVAITKQLIRIGRSAARTGGVFYAEANQPKEVVTSRQASVASASRVSLTTDDWRLTTEGRRLETDDYVTASFSFFFTRTTVTFEKPSSNVGGLSFAAIRRMTSSSTFRSRRRLRSRHTSSGTSKYTAWTS